MEKHDQIYLHDFPDNDTPLSMQGLPDLGQHP